MEYKRLYRSQKNRLFAGVCGGLGEYLNIDPTLVRLLFALGAIFGVGTFFLVYLIMMIVVPEEPGSVPPPPPPQPPAESS
jgi:phage shock protein PspC (stress-responsive transcriptional regulator)